MDLTPAAVLDRVTGGRGTLALRYSMVSVIGVTITQIELFILVGLLDLDATWSNVVAVSLCSIPVFILNKRWVWSHDGKLSLRREILPFWVFTLAGLLLSTILVTIAKDMSDSTLLIMAANIGGFGLLWVAKFLFLDKVMFGRPELDEVLSQEPEAPLGSA
ncbi:MAG TPA: GtrA family protein [Acidimicrobiales bacterium]|nr:GtrA family protein [Acidimicrobiales bacterium]